MCTILKKITVKVILNYSITEYDYKPFTFVFQTKNVIEINH